jgi:predicted phage terminase large subunit-like protein
MDKHLLNFAENNSAVRVLAARHLLDFTKFTMPGYRDHDHHRILAAQLDRVARGECKRLMIFMPPQHGKSELVSRRFPAFMLGRNPNLRLIACSHTNDLAERMNLDVRRIMTSQSYKQVFPNVQLGQGRGSSILDAQCRLGLFEIAGHRGCLRSAGVGKAIAGNSADGAIIDDPFGSREDADSPIVRQRIWDWFTNDLYTRLSTDAWIVITHTRWHRDDLAGRLLRLMAEGWEIVFLPALREEGPGDPEDKRLPGEPLWPEFKSKKALEIIRRQDPRAFAALYQQNPTDGAAVEWAAEFFGDWMWVPRDKWPTDFHMRVVCVDPSKGSADGLGDYCAIVFAGSRCDGLVFVDAVIERFPLDQIVRKTLQFCDEKRPHFVGIEADQFQELLVHEFRRQCRGRPFHWPVYAMRSKGIPKVSRIRRLSEYVVNRELRFKADSPGCRMLVDQLMDFPSAEHDDGPDALEMCIRLAAEAAR